MTPHAKGWCKTYDEPFEDAEGAIFLVDTVVDVCEQLWSLQPVRCEFYFWVSGGKKGGTSTRQEVRTGEADGRKDERRSGHRVEVPREPCQPARIVVVSGERSDEDVRG